MERSMSAPVMESKQELRKAVEAVTRKPSGDLSPTSPSFSGPRSPTSPFFNEEVSPRSPSSPSLSESMSPRSPSSPSLSESMSPRSPRESVSPRSPTTPSNSGTVSSTEVNILKANSTLVESEPDGWTVVNVNRGSPTTQSPLSGSFENEKPSVSPKPKPVPPVKPKPKSPVPDRVNSGKNFTFSVKNPSELVNSNKEEKPKAAEAEGVIKIEKTYSDYAEVFSSDSESKIVVTSSATGGVKSRLSMFEGGGPVKPPVYAKPDLCRKKAVVKKPEESNNVFIAVENSKTEEKSEEPPALPGRHYTAEDMEEMELPTVNSPSQDLVEGTYEVVEPRSNIKPSSVALQKRPLPSAPPVNKRIESRKDMPPAPPSPFKDRIPPPPVRNVSLSSASIPSKEKSDSIYSEVQVGRGSPSVASESLYSKVEDTRGTSVTSESPYSEVEDTRRTSGTSESPYSEVEDTSWSPEVSRKAMEVEAYYTTDVVRNLPTKAGEVQKRGPPSMPAPYRQKKTKEGEPLVATKAPAKPAPYRPKSMPENLSHTTPSTGREQVTSRGSLDSPRHPVVVPGSPRLHTARLVFDSSSSSVSSSPALDSPPKFKPPPPPRLSSVADSTKEETTFEARVANVSFPSPVNGLAEQEDSSEIPTRDVDASLASSKPFPQPKPDIKTKPNHVNKESAPPNIKPPPPPKISSLAPRAFGVKSEINTTDRDGTETRNGVDSSGMIPPPPLAWLDGKNERSASTTSVDSLDRKIVPPPPMHFKELDLVEVQAIAPPFGWQERTDKNGNFRAPKESPAKTAKTPDFDFPIVPPPPPPPPSGPPPMLPVSGAVDNDLDLVPSLLSNGSGDFSRNLEDIPGDRDNSLTFTSDHYYWASDDEGSLPPAPLPPGERYPGDAIMKPLVPPLRKQR